MFGKHWTAAQGVVVSSHVLRQQNAGSLREYLVDVTTVSGELFRATVQEPGFGPQFVPPVIGMTIRVEYEEKSREVRFDKDDPQMNHKLQREQKDAAFQADLQQPAGTPAASPDTEPMPGFDLQSLLQGQLHVQQIDPGSPEAAKLREALLRATGQAPAADPPAEA
jgi:hypothetical protein